MRNLYHIRVIDSENNHLNLYIKCVCRNDCIFYGHFDNNKNTFHLQAEVKLEDLLNLSILISKGKEIN
jgi:hypothetical protein